MSPVNTAIIDSDVHTPDAAQRSLDAVASVYRALLAQIEQHRANQVAMGISGPVLAFLNTAQDEAAQVVAAAEAGAAEAARQVQVVQDTVGSDPSLAGTQQGRYMDPRAV